jgi:hypothetical protein
MRLDDFGGNGSEPDAFDGVEMGLVNRSTRFSLTRLVFRFPRTVRDEISIVEVEILVSGPLRHWAINQLAFLSASLPSPSASKMWQPLSSLSLGLLYGCLDLQPFGSFSLVCSVCYAKLIADLTANSVIIALTASASLSFCAFLMNSFQQHGLGWLTIAIQICSILRCVWSYVCVQ